MDDFETLLKTIEDLLDFKCSNFKRNYIERRVQSRMNALRITDFRSYTRHILNEPAERELLRNALTINVTKFFRDKEVFEKIRSDVIPCLLKKRSRLHIWSAGCSSGEEAYTLAILLYEISLLNKSMSCVIYATDIDREVLARAKEGIYTRNALENVSESQLKRHFIERDEGRYEIKPHIKNLVKFQFNDLMKGVPAARFLDIVLCRNVTIYFDEKQKNELTRVFFKSLTSDGFYIIGMSEYMGKEVEKLFIPYLQLQRIFIKNSAAE